MNVFRFLIPLVLTAFCGNLAAAPAPQGTFILPWNAAETWPTSLAKTLRSQDPTIKWEVCSETDSKGWKKLPDLYHMQYGGSPTFKYHFGEDWNGKCGLDSDLGAPLYALADGEVIYLDNLNTTTTGGAQGKRIHIRYAFPYSLGTNGVFTFDSVYMHMHTISPRIVTEAGISTGSPSVPVKVSKGELVGLVGKTGIDIRAHLHWEARSNLNLAKTTNPYQTTLSKAYALNYRSPALIVDDRLYEFEIEIPSDQTYKEFRTPNAPFSTAYITYLGQRKTLSQAMAAGWISATGFQWSNNGIWTNWNYSTSSKDYLRFPLAYRIKSLKPNAKLHIPVPRNEFQQDRARFDMIYSVRFNARFTGQFDTRADNGAYRHNPEWSTTFELHQMRFETTIAPTVVLQATSKADPLWRFTCYFDHLTGAYTPWVQVNPNQLY